MCAKDSHVGHDKHMMHKERCRRNEGVVRVVQ